MAGVAAWAHQTRDDFERLLVEALGARTVVVLRGAPGSGKTTAAATATRRLADGGTSVVRIAASPAVEPISLAAFAPIVEARSAPDAVAAVHHLLAATSTPGILVVDDAHALDDASAVVVHQLAVATRIRLLLVIRAGVPTPAAIGRVLAEPDTTTLEPPPFSGDEVAAWIARALDAPVDRRTLRILERASAGNPLYVKELVEGSLASGVLVEHHGVWRFKGELAATPLLEEVVLARIARLAPPERDAIEVIGIAGPVDADVIERAVDPAALESLERAGFLSATGHAPRLIVDVAHPLHRELTRSRLGPLARRAVYARLADAVGEAPRATAVAELTAVQWHLRGGRPCGAERVLAAARLAMAAFDTGLAAELADAAFRARPTAAAALVASWGHAASGDHGAAARILDDALRTEGLDPWDIATCRLRLAEELWWWAHEGDDALRLLEPVEPPGPWNDLLEAQRSVFAALDGRVAEATAAAPLVDHPDLRVRFVAAVATVSAWSHLDRADEAFALAARLHAEASDPDIELSGDPAVFLVGQLLALIHGGRLPEACGVGALLHAASAEHPDPLSRAWGATMHGFALLHAGDPAAGGAFAEGVALWHDCDVDGLTRWAALGGALAAAQERSNDELERTLAVIDSCVGAGFGLYDALVDLARAWRAELTGDGDEVDEHVVRAIGRATDQGNLAHLQLIAHELVRLGRPDPARHLLDRLPEPRSPLARARVALVRAAADDDPDALEAAAGAFAAMGAPRFARETYELAADAARRQRRMSDARRFEHLAGRRADGWGPLTARETEIARLAASGLPTREIAARLVIGERTVETHLGRIFTKLGIRSRGDLRDLVPTADEPSTY